VSFDNSVTSDRLWHDKYNLRTAQIPSFISEKQARKVIKNNIFQFNFYTYFLE
jgi:hypothetical protein